MKGKPGLKNSLLDFTAQIILLVFVGAIVIIAQGYPSSARSFPTIIGGVTFILLCGLIWNTIRHGSNAPDKVEKSLVIRWLPTALGVPICIFLIWLLGYVIGSFLSMVGVMYFLGLRRPFSIFIWSAGTVFSLWLVFQRLLLVPLPSGLLF